MSAQVKLSMIIGMFITVVVAILLIHESYIAAIAMWILGSICIGKALDII